MFMLYAYTSEILDEGCHVKIECGLCRNHQVGSPTLWHLTHQQMDTMKNKAMMYLRVNVYVPYTMKKIYQGYI